MKRLVVGYGNTLRRDDGIGAVVAQCVESEAVKRLGPEAADLHVITPFQLLPEHAEILAGADIAVFVDAAVGDTPGEVRCLEPSAEPVATGLHGMGVTALSQLAATLYGGRSRIVVVAVTAETFEFGESLSPAVEAAVDDAVAAVFEIFGSLSVGRA